MHFPAAILTLLPTLLIPPYTLALPNPPNPSPPGPNPNTPNEPLPGNAETFTLITSLLTTGLSAIKLDEAVKSFTGENVDEVRTRSSELENNLTQATSTATSTGELDDFSSKKIADICVPLKPVFSEMLKDISDKRREFFEADYDQDMLQTLQRLRPLSRGLAEALKAITTEGDGAFIMFLEDLIDVQFALTIVEYEMNKGW